MAARNLLEPDTAMPGITESINMKQ